MGTDQKPLTLEIGRKLSSAEAKAFTDNIKQRMYARWNERIFGGPFMRDLEAGKLPFETIKLFWRHWYSYPVEINNFHLIIYQRHQGIFARHRDLLAPYVGKISDELVNPSIPGHIQVLIKQGETFGVTIDEMVNCQVYEEADLHEHEDGLMAHGQVARMIFETLLQDGLTWYRPGWGPEYCCLTNAEYVALFHDGIYKHSQNLGHF